MHTLAFKDAVKQDGEHARFRLIPLGVQLDLRLTRSAPLGTQEHIYIKGCFALEHVIDGPRQFMRQDGERFSFGMRFSERTRSFWPWGLFRKNNAAASEKAHVRWALPMFLPEVPQRLPADSFAPLTRRHYETKSCPRGKRAMSWIS